MTKIYFNESTYLGGIGVSITQEFDILKYINENDVFNSYIIYILSTIDTTDYTITKYEGRVDLISKELFDDPLYYPIIMFLNPYSTYKLKEVIKIINKDQLTDIFNKVQEENELVENFSNEI